LFINCVTLPQLVNMASGNANDTLNVLLRNRAEGGFRPVRGGPPWVDTDRFTIEARSSTVTDRKALQGPMLLALLEDRFQMKFHRASEDRPVYVLKVAAGGIKLQAIVPGSCYELDPANLPAPYSIGGQQICGTMTRAWGPFRMIGAKLGKTPMAAFSTLSNHLSTIMDRAVLDHTGLDARYDVEFAYTPDDRTPGYLGGAVPPGYEKLREPEPGRADGPNIFKALENLGLKLEPAKWPIEYLVIDRVERPTPNPPSPSASR
jgi:uncharacterized protein (TIGR03435 family)